jgi:hypothetical protein
MKSAAVKEFWIEPLDEDDYLVHDNREVIRYKAPEQIIHVIEYQALLEERARSEKLVEALEACAGGDLASGEGIYKAEIAREALEAYSKQTGSGE